MYKIDYSIEMWKPLECYDIKKGMYMISSFGNIKSINKNIILKQFIHSKNAYTYYKTVSLVLNSGKSKKFLVHRLVAQSFIPIKHVGQIQVNHKDCNTFNNHLENLEWVTPKENTLYALKYGNIKKCEDVYNSKFTNNDVEIICQLLMKNYDYGYILNKIGFENTENNRDLISNIKVGKTYKSISSKYDLQSIEKINSKYYTAEQIRTMKQYISNGYNYIQIADIMGEDINDYKNKKRFYEFIRRLSKGEIFKNL